MNVTAHLHFQHVSLNFFVDKAAEELYPTWKENFEQWKLVGSDRPYHYLGSAIWYNRIGKEMGKSMLELLENESK